MNSTRKRDQEGKRTGAGRIVNREVLDLALFDGDDLAELDICAIDAQERSLIEDHTSDRRSGINDNVAVGALR